MYGQLKKRRQYYTGYCSNFSVNFLNNNPTQFFTKCITDNLDYKSVNTVSKIFIFYEISKMFKYRLKCPIYLCTINGINIKNKYSN